MLARDFPPVPGQAYGPGLFPMLLGGALVVCAIATALQAPPPRRVPTAHGRIAALGCALAPLVMVLAWDSAGWPLIALGLGAALLVLGVNLVFSVLGGILGTTVLVMAAPTLADTACSASA